MNKKTFQYVTAALCFVSAVVILIHEEVLVSLFRYGSLNWRMALCIIGTALFGVSFLIKREILMPAGAVLYAIPHLLWVVSILEDYGMVSWLSLLILVALAALSVSCFLKQGKAYFRIAAAVLFLAAFIYNTWSFELIFVAAAILIDAVVELIDANGVAKASVEKVVTEQECASADELVEKLSKLKQLQDIGALTQEEFDQQKAKLLR